jgi:ribonuclease HI
VRSRKALSKNREVSLHLGHIHLKIETVLLGTHHQSSYRVPTKKNLQKPDLSGRLINWAIELREFDIKFYLRLSLKGQVVIEFIVELSNILEEEEVPLEKAWIAYVDGSSKRKYSGVGVILKGPNGEECKAAMQFQFATTNNEAEYKATIAGMNIAREMRVKILEVKSESQVVVGHVKGEYKAREDKMKRYLEKVKEIMGSFNKVTFTRVPKEENSVADALTRITFATEEEITTLN